MIRMLVGEQPPPGAKFRVLLAVPGRVWIGFDDGSMAACDPEDLVPAGVFGEIIDVTDDALTVLWGNGLVLSYPKDGSPLPFQRVYGED